MVTMNLKPHPIGIDGVEMYKAVTIMDSFIAKMKTHGDLEGLNLRYKIKDHEGGGFDISLEYNEGGGELVEAAVQQYLYDSTNYLDLLPVVKSPSAHRHRQMRAAQLGLTSEKKRGGGKSRRKRKYSKKKKSSKKRKSHKKKKSKRRRRR